MSFEAALAGTRCPPVVQRKGDVALGYVGGNDPKERSAGPVVTFIGEHVHVVHAQQEVVLQPLLEIPDGAAGPRGQSQRMTGVRECSGEK